MEKMEVTLVEATVQRLKLEQGEVLFVTVKSDEVDQDNLDALSNGLKTRFPNNKIVVFGLGVTDDIKLTVVKDNVSMGSDCSKPTEYCSNCSCGKKEAIEGA